MTIEGRRTGWLTHMFHAQFRELLLHALARYQLACPAYCLMPDHLHLLWLGLAPSSDQRLAAQFFRQHMNRLLASGGTLKRPATPPPVAEGVSLPPASLAKQPLGTLTRSATPLKLQKQGYDHVLRRDERGKDALGKVAFYILENPARKELVKSRDAWPFSGGMVAGYPDLDPRQDDYWERFWKLYWKLAEP
jgi:putative transposase